MEPSLRSTTRPSNSLHRRGHADDDEDQQRPSALSLALGVDAIAVSTRSIRDPAKGIYEYLEERHEEQGIHMGCHLFPMRLSGWIFRREGLFTKKYKRRFCVFDAASNELSLFADDNISVETGKLLRRVVVTKISMATCRSSDQSDVQVEGFQREKEICGDDAERIAARRRASSGSSRTSSTSTSGMGSGASDGSSSRRRRRFAGEKQQRFYRPQHESLRTVSAKQTIVWSHCFRHHMKNLARRRRLVRLTQLNETGRWDQVDEEELEELLDGDEDEEEDDEDGGGGDMGVEREFSFYEQRLDEPVARREHDRQRDRDRRRDPLKDQLIFDDESDIRISKSCRFSSLGVHTDGGDGFPSRLPTRPLPAARHTRQTQQQHSRTAAHAIASPLASHWTDSTTFTTHSSGDMFVLSSAASIAPLRSQVSMSMSSSSSSGPSIWEDDDLLVFRVDFDAIQRTRLLSTGAFGDVWLATYRTQTLAVKCLKLHSSVTEPEPRRQQISAFKQEIRLLSRLHHERIVSFCGVAWTMESDLQLLMEYLPYGDLRTYCQYQSMLQRDDEKKKTKQRPKEVTWTHHQWRLAVDTAEALVYLHSLQVPLVHGDLKSRNLLLTSDLRVKLGDFGSARFAADPMDGEEKEEDGDTSPSGGGYTAAAQHAFLGTGRWIAPERLAGSAEYTPAVDLYSFGVVLSEIDTNEMPFHDKLRPHRAKYQREEEDDDEEMTETVLLHHIMADGWTPSFSSSCPPEILTIAQKCMAFHPEHRPSSLDVAHRLRKAMAQATRTSPAAAAAP